MNNGTIGNRVCVFGASRECIPEEVKTFAHKLGILLAENNYGLVFGAGATGLMGACARGVYSRGGEIIGVIPEKLNKPGIYFENCTRRIVTETMHERKALMEKLSCAFIALPGGFGTIEELAEVLTLKQLGYHNHPIIIVNLLGYYDNFLNQLKRCVTDGYTHNVYLDSFTVATTAEQVIEQLQHHVAHAMPNKLETLDSNCSDNKNQSEAG